jgi:hypothetical protein
VERLISLIFISHRGNLNGPNPDRENHPDYVRSAITSGYDVEIDVWKKGKDFYLGHDEPQYQVNWKFLTNPSLWCHAKDIDALREMMSIGAHCFFHQNDDFVLTSRGFIWTYPGNQTTPLSICVMPETEDIEHISMNCYGICSDFISKYRKRIK